MTQINTHKDYDQQKPLVTKVRDCIKGQEWIQSKGETYLKKTSGMASRGTDGDDHYEAYKDAARFTNMVQDTENGIIGLAFKTAPEIDIPFDVVTNNGRDIESLLRSQLREILETGRGVMLVDAPVDGGDPYITEYKSESLINWAVADDNDAKIVAAKFEEEYFEPEDLYKSEPKKRYREYKLVDGKPLVTLLDEKENQLAEPKTLDLDYIPVFLAGSVDNMPDSDPIPLLPVAHCAIAIYQIGADYRQWLHVHGQGTPWVSGVTNVGDLIKCGMGVGAVWGLPEGEQAGMLENGAGSAKNFIEAMQREQTIAEQYMVAITSQGSGIEAAESMKLRAATKHATIYTVLNSLSSATTSAIECMAEWSGKSVESTVKLNSDFTELEASSQLITALQGSINAESLPVSVLRNVVRDAGYTDLTDQEMDGQILDAGGTGIN